MGKYLNVNVSYITENRNNIYTVYVHNTGACMITRIIMC
jgi:hypothetical protein